MYEARQCCGLKVLPIDSLMVNTTEDSRTCVCMAKYICTFPVVLPDLESPTELARVFPKASRALALLFMAEQCPLRSCPWKVGKGDGCSLALGTNE